jgi:2-(1,2-epoxy-1,2-dihydrophenyl)acetyl-CoA isomerase
VALDVRIEEGCAWVTLRRPERLNALDGPTFAELGRCAAALAADESVRAVVLTGAGRAFCAGADLRSFGDEVDVGDPHAVRARLREVGRVVRAWFTLEKPTIAAVNGPALGGGCNLALACDLVLMREDATIGEVYVQRGLVPDMGGTYVLPRLVGRARAMELALLGDALDAPTAERIGLVNRCLPVAAFEEEVARWARRLAEGPTRALAMTKTGLLHAPLMDLDAALEWEAQAIAMVFQTDDVREAFAAFREGREPRFTGR